MDRFIRRFLIYTLILFFTSSAAYAGQLRFIQFTDCHLSLNGRATNGRDLENSEQNLKEAVKSINSRKDIDFVIFSGDNINSAKRDVLTEFCKIVSRLNKPYYVTLGNHDVMKYGGLSKGKYIEMVRKYDKYQKSNNPYYYFFPNKNFIVVVMDGSHQVIPSTHGSYSDEDLAWLDKVLTKYNNRKVIIVQHFPIVEPHENKSHRVFDPEKYMNLLSRHKNIITLLSGHYHDEKVTLQDGIYHISSPAFVQSPHEYRVIEINYKKPLLKKDMKFDLKTELIPVTPTGQQQ